MSATLTAAAVGVAAAPTLPPAELPPTPLPSTALPVHWSVADLRRHLGDIPLNRIRLYPPPGMATEADALAVHDRGGPICELIDGILVEKDMSSPESLLALVLARWIGNFLEQHPLGILLGADGQLRILPERMRVPDISFIHKAKLPDGRLPQDAVFRIVPDLAVEVISAGNTKREMDIKRREYLKAGVRLIWYIDPKKRTANVYRGDGTSEKLNSTGTLDGGDVLPGFTASLEKLFAEIDRNFS